MEQDSNIPELNDVLAGTQGLEVTDVSFVEQGFVDQVVALQSDHDIVRVVIDLINGDAIFSDILLHEGNCVTVREAKQMREVTEWTVTREHLEEFFEKINPNWEIDIQSRAFDRAMDFTNCRVRVNCFKYLGGKKIGAAIRVNPPAPLSFKEIGLSVNAINLAQADRGLILVVGDTCQGKSTTLASIMDHINSTRSGHIITAEDPIETIIPNRKCVVTQREVGDHGDIKSFYMGALDALRERPDVIMFGEIRDPETAREALALAESGPIVFGSLHARTPERAIMKYLRMLGDESHHRKALSATLTGIICQSLVPHKNQNRYILATEVMKNGNEFQELIEKESYTNIRSKLNTTSTIPGKGSHTMNFELMQMLDADQISPVDAMKASTDKENLRESFDRKGISLKNPT